MNSDTIHSTASTSPQVQAYEEAFRAIARDAEVLFEAVSDDAFNARPALGSWSAGECLDHLNTTGGLLLPNLDAAIRRARERGLTARGPFRYGPLSRWFVASMQPGGRKATAPALYVPSSSRLRKEDVLRAFLALQEALIERLRQADGLDLRRVMVPSPVTRLIRVSLGAWFEATAAHERRHLLQARRALEAQRER